MLQIKEEVLSCDVLVVGGGIAGLMAAIAASDNGAKVILCDKGDTLRSGSGATGNDHFACYIRSYHNNDKETWMKEFKRSMVGAYSDTKLQSKFADMSEAVVEDWYKWGINMKPHDKYEFLGHAMPGHMRVFLKYDGENQKAVLTKEAKARGVQIENRSPVTEYLVDKDNKIAGVVALDINEPVPVVKVYKAKAVISTTGNTSRLYPTDTVYNLFNTAHCPCNAGGGRAAAYRVGAKLVNLEIPNTHAGPKNFERCGKATWIGVLTDSDQKPLGPFVQKPDRELGDFTADVWHGVFSEPVQTGAGPVFMNCTETSDEDLEYMRWAFKCEGATSIVDALDQQELPLRENMIEFTQYEPILIGRGIQIDLNAATNVPGLYAAGDEIGNFRADIGGAAVIGRIAGESAAKYAADAKPSDIDMSKISELQEFYSSFMERTEGAKWQELNAGIQQTMDRYAGIKNPRSKTMLEAGYNYLEHLRTRAIKDIKCSTAHELMRTLESFDLLQIGQLICLTAEERKECRGMHKRAEYTYTNPLLDNKFLNIYKAPGQEEPVLEWRDEY
ncbi:FAD-dependent oxidoreductase [Peptococcus simiae]|uniref:FAD-dependent oxidoreductase n=1 Tax=Peptococcus simiae TaxID=1643805 RepID=UPI00398103E5